MKLNQHLLASACALAVAGTVTFASVKAQQPAAGGTAEYWLSAETSSGFGADMMGARNPSAAMMGAMFGGRDDDAGADRVGAGGWPAVPGA